MDAVSTQIVGELYHVDDNLICTLDNMENHPDTYTRQYIQLCAYKEPVFAYIVDNHDLIDCITKSHRFSIVAEGDWVNFCNHS